MKRNDHVGISAFSLLLQIEKKSEHEWNDDFAYLRLGLGGEDDAVVLGLSTPITLSSSALSCLSANPRGVR